MIVGQHFGELPPEDPKADVNGDGSVNIFDLVLVGQHFGERYIPGAPEVWSMDCSTYLAELRRLYKIVRSHPEASQLNSLLERLISLAERGEIPQKTALLQNYPNPFNPETWIPFQLRKGEDVVITIYDLKGRVIRRFDLGYREAGVYLSRDKALHWDGRNELGEKVASGIYLYELRAGDFKAVKKMVIAR